MSNNQTFQKLLADGKVKAILEVETRNNQLWQKARIDHGELYTDEWFCVGANGVSPMGRPPKHPEIDWNQVDWNKSSRELSAELGVEYNLVCSRRHIFGHPKVGTAKTRHIDWTSVDWTKNNQQIAAELKININSVVGYRHRFGQPSKSYASTQRKVTKEMIEAVDWLNTKDITISKQWSVSRERVRQIRLVEGKPRCIITTTIGTFQEIEKWLLANKDSISGKLAHEVSDMCPVDATRDLKFRVMKKVDIQFVWTRVNSPLSTVFNINWDIPNNLLNWIWNRHCNWAGANRWRLQKSKAKWFRDHNRLSGEEFARLPELLKAVTSEIEKARKIGIKPRIKELREYGFDVS